MPCDDDLLLCGKLADVVKDLLVVPLIVLHCHPLDNPVNGADDVRRRLAGPEADDGEDDREDLHDHRLRPHPDILQDVLDLRGVCAAHGYHCDGAASQPSSPPSWHARLHLQLKPFPRRRHGLLDGYLRVLCQKLLQQAVEVVLGRGGEVGGQREHPEVLHIQAVPRVATRSVSWPFVGVEGRTKGIIAQSRCKALSNACIRAAKRQLPTVDELNLDISSRCLPNETVFVDGLSLAMLSARQDDTSNQDATEEHQDDPKERASATHHLALLRSFRHGGCHCEFRGRTTRQHLRGLARRIIAAHAQASKKAATVGEEANPHQDEHQGKATSAD
mmetsp:Transcript_46747/g.124967  ORF Transcript_46747/g.124967 Transcript_46747/m.124967 type:complete len:332 (-) Transcript_46747:554-1549(-)